MDAKITRKLRANQTKIDAVRDAEWNGEITREDADAQLAALYAKRNALGSGYGVTRQR